MNDSNDPLLPSKPRPSAGLRIRVMMPDDLSFADSVRALAGWNQTLGDWQRFLSCEPGGCFVAERHGAPAGTAITICYASGLGWIGMLLVHPEHRRCGIGSALLHHCLDYLDQRGMRTAGLDATPLGQPLYERLGFVREWNLTRWETPAVPAVTPGSNTRPLGPVDRDEIIALDRKAFGSERRLLLEQLTQNALHAVVWRSPRQGAFGYGILRAGSRALYLGPIAATGANVATEVIHHLLGCVPGKPVFWDVPDFNLPAKDLAQTLGFAPQRPLVRMFRGARPAAGDFHLQYGIADPAVG